MDNLSSLQHAQTTAGERPLLWLYERLETSVVSSFSDLPRNSIVYHPGRPDKTSPSSFLSPLIFQLGRFPHWLVISSLPYSPSFTFPSLAPLPIFFFSSSIPLLPDSI
jgi:hypothetical protein